MRVNFYRRSNGQLRSVRVFSKGDSVALRINGGESDPATGRIEEREYVIERYPNETPRPGKTFGEKVILSPEEAEAIAILVLRERGAEFRTPRRFDNPADRLVSDGDPDFAVDIYTTNRRRQHLVHPMPQEPWWRE